MGCDDAGLKGNRAVIEFQFTHPRGVRRVPIAADAHVGKVSIHAPRGVRLSTLSPANTAPPFQFTHPRGVRHIGSTTALTLNILFQFTHPRGVRPKAIIDYWKKLCFNSRTRVGCDSSAFPRSISTSGFNSRTRVGCDQHCQIVVLFKPIVSIHAPAWGATFLSRSCWQAASGFNSRTRVGCDIPPLAKDMCCRRRFNSRTRVGCDWSFSSPCSATKSFNSRTRVGCDNSPRRKSSSFSKFQFTHPRGVRRD